MQPSTGPSDATLGPEQYRQGPPSPGTGAYGAPSVLSTGGRCLVAPTSAGDYPAARALNASGLKSGASARKGVERSVTHLPPAGREEQLKRWGLNASPRWSEAERRPRFSDELDTTDDDDAGDGRELEELGFILDGGWTAVEPAKGRGHGTTSHRGVLHPDEHVDPDALRAAVESELGFSYDDVRAVYRQGRMTNAQVELRTRIDARLLAISEAGGQMLELARALGWTIKAASASGGQSCDTMERALARARKER